MHSHAPGQKTDGSNLADPSHMGPLHRPEVLIERIDRLVAVEFALKPADLKTHGHRAGAAKRIALELACRLTGWTHREIGAYYGGISSGAVCTARRKVREQARAAARTARCLQEEATQEDGGQQ
jgi:chromosomal replication initiation ATPase DnaA